MLSRIKTKDTAIGLLVLIGLAGVCFSCYTLFGRLKNKYQADGYNSALQQLVTAAQTEREMTVTVGEKSVKFIVVEPTPASQAPTP